MTSTGSSITSDDFTWDTSTVSSHTASGSPYSYEKKATPGVRAGESEQIRDRQGNLWVKDMPLVPLGLVSHPDQIPKFKKGMIGVSCSSGIEYISGTKGYWFRMDCSIGRALYKHYVENPMKKDKRKFELETRVKLNKISPENEPKNIFHFLEACKLGLVKPSFSKEKEDDNDDEFEYDLPF